MSWVAQHLWLIPLMPLVAAGVIALCKQSQRHLAASLAIGSMGAALLLSIVAFLLTLGHAQDDGAWRATLKVSWFETGHEMLCLGWVLDPLSAVMLVMVSFVGLQIFIYSVGYMADDPNFTRFFCFLSLFSAAMLGLVVANNLLLLFMCWELVGFASYILIGFWYQKPSAAAAAKKAFITTRIGDIGLFLGMLWLYAETGTLQFYDGGQGCLEGPAVTRLAAQSTLIGMGVSTGISLLIFAGAMGKSGQVPLHVWLPDAMEGPTPVSALIHAATMVAAGVFLVARMYPLMSAGMTGPSNCSFALSVVTWVGAITAVFAASIAVAQTDIKRILAYSTVSQLGYMMMGLGVGGVAVGMFHLITHAFFKALLFMGAGSVIHGAHGEQDIRHMGALRKHMPMTFATYAVGMMALSGVPLFFSGFWSKDAILHTAHNWPVSAGPFYLGLFGAFLTAFYMTRQVCYVFFGPSRSKHQPEASPGSHAHSGAPHESPPVMTIPLLVLAVCAIVVGFIGTPAWPWFEKYFAGKTPGFSAHRLFEAGVPGLMLLSALIVFAGIGLGVWLYWRKPIRSAQQLDAVELVNPVLFGALKQKLWVDELYEATVIRLNAWSAWFCDILDRWVWGGAVQVVSLLALGLSWLDHFIDEYLVNLGFDQGCGQVRRGAAVTSSLQDGQVQNYLRVIGVALTVLVLLLTWGYSR